MAGSVHPVQTVELLVAMIRQGYAGIIYFDTFPDHSGLNPVTEAQTKIRLTDRLWDLALRMADDPDLARAQARQDAAAATALVMAALFGA